MKALYHITNETAVDARFARKLADVNNDEQQRPDWILFLMAAPEVGADEPSAIIYMSTNGDPVYIASICPESTYHITEEMGWTEEEGDVPNWLLALREFGFSGSEPEEAIEFIEDKMCSAGMVD